MTTFIFAVLFLAIAVGSVVVRKTYYFLPAKELKRQAAHDPVAARFYGAVAYGSSLRALLWGVTLVSSTVGVLLLAKGAPFWLSLLLVVVLLWSVFSWLPATRVTGVGARLTAIVTPGLVWVLERLYPLLSRGAEKIEKRYASRSTGIYERSDILELIEQQAEQDDSRLSIEELAIIQRALTFGDYEVHDIITPRAQVKTVLANDTVGPILIDEIHQSVSPFVLVLDKPKGDVVGCVIVQQLGIHSEGLVSDHMHNQVYYVHESDTLREALHAFFVTNCPMFVVVNSHEEYVGIVTMEAVVRQLLGHLPGEEFEQYADRAAVAARYPRVKPATKKPAKKAEKAAEDGSEVVK
ncbi:MAG: magnesium/cobalt efflux protein [Candidatus Saccharibacteria bacterium]|nr:magnesium/cobalt efflux protein [Candidatus Saccharibacteria bacterium]